MDAALGHRDVVAASVTGAVGSVTTVSDKTGYSLHGDYDAAKTAAQAGAGLGRKLLMSEFLQVATGMGYRRS